MIATLCIAGCVLVTGQAEQRPTWLLTPHLSRGQEFVYERGLYTEESLGRIQCKRSYRVDSRLFVLESSPRGAQLAMLTIVRPPEEEKSGGHDGTPVSVRLELVTTDPQGRVLPDRGQSLAAPLDGPPTAECGQLVGLSPNRVGVGGIWLAAEEGRTPRMWKLLGSESAAGAVCLKLAGEQRSADWDRPRADSTAWRRLDTVWLSPRFGIAHKVRRVIERRDPGHNEATHRSELTYELANAPLEYPEQFYQDRRIEIQQARAFWETALPWLSNPGQHAAQLDALLGRIDYHLRRQSPTPYREAVLRVKRRVEAARKGEALVTVGPTEPLVPTATVGKLAPDFVAPDFGTRGTTRLRAWAGKPVLMVFYHPTWEQAGEMLRYAEGVQDLYRGRMTVLALAVSDDGDGVRRQREGLKLSYPVLCGTGLRRTYALDSMPKFYVLDAAGVVRGSYVGWGLDTQESVAEELRACLQGR
jgi:hypothetical protein